MSSRVMSLIFFALGATIASSAQQCCTCVRDGGQGFQVPGACLTCRCDIACKANGGTYVSTQPCVGPNNPNPPPGSVPVPNTSCYAFFNPFDGNCQGNHWIECELAIYQRTPVAVAGEPVLVQFTSQNLGQETGPPPWAVRHRLSVDGSVDWGDDTPKTHLDTGNYTLIHTYAKPGGPVVSAEIHGDFKWNEPGAGNNSCSYRARTEPSRKQIDVLPRVAADIDLSAFRLTSLKQENGIFTATLEPTGDKIVNFDVTCGHGNRFRINGGSNRSKCTMDFKQTSDDWQVRRVDCQYPNLDSVQLDCEKLANACVQSKGASSCTHLVKYTAGPSTAAAPTRPKELPKSGSPLPLLGLMGIGLLILGSRLRR